MKIVLNLGAGVQSTTVLRMAIRGELPRPDHVIFADTGWEPRAVYEHLEILKVEMLAAGLDFHIVSSGNIKEDQLLAIAGDASAKKYANMPLYITRQDGAAGMLNRQCTAEYKIDPITRKTRELCGITKRKFRDMHPVVERWMGISADEERRCRLSNEWWAINHYPLVELGMTRNDCIEWNAKNGFPCPPRSACIACPYRHNKEWAHMRDTSPNEFEEACSFDESIRSRGGVFGEMFVHLSRKPLREVQLVDEESASQMSLFSDECAGMCGV